MSRSYVIGLGSNLGSRAATFDAAIKLLRARDGIRIERCSPLYASEPLGPPQPGFLNAAVRVTSELDASAMLDCVLSAEQALGRVRTERWGARSIDLDLLWSDHPHREPALCVPHLELEERWFALQPLLDVAPELAPLYGARLGVLGGRRAPEGTLAELTRAEVLHEPGALSIAAGGNADEASAAILAALGRALDAESTCQALRTIALPCSGDAQPFAEACALIERGFALEAASIAPTGDGERSTARVIGAQVAPHVAIRVDDVRRDARALCVRFAFRPR